MRDAKAYHCSSTTARHDLFSTPVFSFYQVVGLFGDVYQITYPPQYLKFLASFAFFKLDFAFVFRLDCIEGYNWHATLYTTLVAFACLTFVQAFLLLVLETASAANKATPQSLKKAATIVVVITYAAYPR